jgi:hypothetical protein
MVREGKVMQKAKGAKQVLVRIAVKEGKVVVVAVVVVVAAKVVRVPVAPVQIVLIALLRNAAKLAQDQVQKRSTAKNRVKAAVMIIRILLCHQHHQVHRHIHSSHHGHILLRNAEREVGRVVGRVVVRVTARGMEKVTVKVTVKDTARVVMVGVAVLTAGTIRTTCSHVGLVM